MNTVKMNIFVFFCFAADNAGRRGHRRKQHGQKQRHKQKQKHPSKLTKNAKHKLMPAMYAIANSLVELCHNLICLKICLSMFVLLFFSLCVCVFFSRFFCAVVRMGIQIGKCISLSDLDFQTYTMRKIAAVAAAAAVTTSSSHLLRKYLQRKRMTSNPMIFMGEHAR